MFYSSQFNGDLSRWDTSSVVDMSLMFGFAIIDEGPF
jgi:surface protein